MKVPKISRCRLAIFVGVLVLCDSAGSIAAENSSRWLLSPKLLEQANLKTLWQNKLPIRNDEKLERLFILDNRIYALSDHNYIVSLDREKGDVIFSKPIAPPGLPVPNLELYGGELIAIIDNKLVQIDPEFGTEKKADNLETGTVCPVVRNNSYFYLAGVDRRLHALRASNRVQAFEVAVENEPMITSIIANERSVIFGTDTGNVISITPDKPKQLWRFDAPKAIAGPLVKDRMSLFFACKDTNVYRIDIVHPRRVELVWKCQIQGLLDRAPRVGKNVVYQYAQGKGLTAIDKRNGSTLWSLREGLDLLTEVAGKAYVFTNTSTLVVMDNKKAKELYRVNFAGVSIYAANTADSKIYIADKRGRLACLEPVEL